MNIRALLAMVDVIFRRHGLENGEWYDVKSIDDYVNWRNWFAENGIREFGIPERLHHDILYEIFDVERPYFGLPSRNPLAGI